MYYEQLQCLYFKNTVHITYEVNYNGRTLHWTKCEQLFLLSDLTGRTII